MTRSQMLAKDVLDRLVAFVLLVASLPLLVVAAGRHLPLRRAMLPERRTGAALGDMQMISDMLDAGTASRGAQ